MDALKKLPPFDPKSNHLNVVIDTPKGCRNKFAYDNKRKTYALKSVLPEGTVFPFDFGFHRRKDRIIAVAAESHTHRDIKSLDDLNQALLEQIEHFFVSYNQERGKKFKSLGHRGPKRARSLVHKHTRKAKR